MHSNLVNPMYTTPTHARANHAPATERTSSSTVSWKGTGAGVTPSSPSTVAWAGQHQAPVPLRTLPQSAVSSAQWVTRSQGSTLSFTSASSSTPLPPPPPPHRPFSLPTASSTDARTPTSSVGHGFTRLSVSGHKCHNGMPEDCTLSTASSTSLGPLSTEATRGGRKRPLLHSSSSSTVSTSPMAPPPGLQDLTSDDLTSRGNLSQDEELSQVVMSVSWTQGKLGAAFYDVTSYQVHVVEDKVEAAPDFWVLRSLFREQQPRCLLVGGRQDERLFSVLRELCGGRPSPHCGTPQAGLGTGGRATCSSTTSSRSPASSSWVSSSSCCDLRVLPMGDFKYELCVRRVLSLSLPGEPPAATEGERELFVRGLVNTDLVSMTRALGALLRFLDTHGLEVASPGQLLEGTPVLGLHVYPMEDLAQLDEATVVALQLFSEDQHPAAFKSGKTSASKEGLSLYALLSRNSCPMASHTLRRVLVRPVVDRAALEGRYAAVGWGVDPGHLDTLRQLQTCLRHVTNVTYTVGRLRRGQLNVRDWKALYKSLFNVILIGEICQSQDQDIPIFRQTGEGVTEGLYRATFLIQRIMDLEQSEKEARFVVKPGVDPELDDKKRRFSGLGEVMRKVAGLELTRLPQEVESCCIIYLPHVGYLLAFPPSPAHEAALAPTHYSLPGLHFMFKTADMVFYKSDTCYELDRELGDIQVEIANHETRIMMRLVDALLQQSQAFLALVDRVLMLDCLLSFSVVARECGWVRPELTEARVFEVEGGRHPLHELCTPTFVANSVVSGGTFPSLTLVTGPNASGKTVYLKQVGVLALLAQVGSWVPASRARLRPLDAIIAVTQTTPPVTSALSTFMTDLTRMCAAVARATRHSLVIVDEFGSATYENDGAALLTACLDHWGSMTSLTTRSLDGEEGAGETTYGGDEGSECTSGGDRRGRRRRRRRASSDDGTTEDYDRGGRGCPHVFVATHLLQVYDHLQRPETVRPMVLEAVQEGGVVVPLYQVAEGRATASYAAAVASLAGVPSFVVDRANQVCKCIRSGRLPPKWTLLEDEAETRRCEVVVSLFLAHDPSRDPLLPLLKKIHGCCRPSEAPSSLLLPPEPHRELQQPTEPPKDLHQPPGPPRDFQQPIEPPHDLHQSPEVPNNLQQPPEPPKNLRQPPNHPRSNQQPTYSHRDLQQPLELPKNLQQPPELPRDIHQFPDLPRNLHQPPEPHNLHQPPEPPRDIHRPTEPPKNLRQPPERPRESQQPTEPRRDLHQPPEPPRDIHQLPDPPSNLHQAPGPLQNHQSSEPPKNLQQLPDPPKNLSQPPESPRDNHQPSEPPRDFHQRPKHPRDLHQTPGSLRNLHLHPDHTSCLHQPHTLPGSDRMPAETLRKVTEEEVVVKMSREAKAAEQEPGVRLCREKKEEEREGQGYAPGSLVSAADYAEVVIAFGDSTQHTRSATPQHLQNTPQRMPLAAHQSTQFFTPPKTKNTLQCLPPSNELTQDSSQHTPFATPQYAKNTPQHFPSSPSPVIVSSPSTSQVTPGSIPQGHPPSKAHQMSSSTTSPSSLTSPPSFKARHISLNTYPSPPLPPVPPATHLPARNQILDVAAVMFEAFRSSRKKENKTRQPDIFPKAAEVTAAGTGRQPTPSSGSEAKTPRTESLNPRSEAPNARSKAVRARRWLISPGTDSEVQKDTTFLTGDSQGHESSVGSYSSPESLVLTRHYTVRHSGWHSQLKDNGEEE